MVYPADADPSLPRLPEGVLNGAIGRGFAAYSTFRPMSFTTLPHFT